MMEKWVKDLSWPFTEKDIQKGNKHMKKYLTSMQKSVKIVGSTSILERPVYMIWPWLASENLDFKRIPTLTGKSSSLCLFEQTI